MCFTHKNYEEKNNSVYLLFWLLEQVGPSYHELFFNVFLQRLTGAIIN